MTHDVESTKTKSIKTFDRKNDYVVHKTRRRKLKQRPTVHTIVLQLVYSTPIIGLRAARSFHDAPIFGCHQTCLRTSWTNPISNFSVSEQISTEMNLPKYFPESHSYTHPYNTVHEMLRVPIGQKLNLYSTLLTKMDIFQTLFGYKNAE